jgi:hypothetical protein
MGFGHMEALGKILTNGAWRCSGWHGDRVYARSGAGMTAEAHQAPIPFSPPPDGDGRAYSNKTPFKPI